jgi:hypothetical protein
MHARVTAEANASPFTQKMKNILHAETMMSHELWEHAAASGGSGCMRACSKVA